MTERMLVLFLTDLVNKAIDRGEGLDYMDFGYPEGITL